jgi:hypothetical protein
VTSAGWLYGRGCPCQPGRGRQSPTPWKSRFDPAPEPCGCNETVPPVTGLVGAASAPPSIAVSPATWSDTIMSWFSNSGVVFGLIDQTEEHDGRPWVEFYPGTAERQCRRIVRRKTVQEVPDDLVCAVQVGLNEGPVSGRDECDVRSHVCAGVVEEVKAGKEVLGPEVGVLPRLTCAAHTPAKN